MNKITIYGIDGCSWCSATENYFKEKDIKYNYIKVSEDKNALNLMIEKTGQQGVPVINVNGTYIVGYNVSKIEEKLE